MNPLVWVIVGVVLVAGAVVLVIVGRRAASDAESDDDPLMARLAEFAERGDVGFSRGFGAFATIQ